MRALALLCGAGICFACPPLHASDFSSPSNPPSRRDAAMVESLYRAELRERQRADAPSVMAAGVVVELDGAPLALSEPAVFEDGEFWLPLRSIAAALYFTVVELAPDRVELISKEGQTRTLAVLRRHDRPVVTPEDLIRDFGVQVHTDAATQTVSIHTPAPHGFQATLEAKPPEELEAELAEERLVQRANEPPALPAYLPDEAKPDVDLRGSVSTTYIKRHGLGPLRSVVSSVEGKWYGFDVHGQDARKDINGVFDHDYSYLNFEKPDLFIGLWDQQVDLAPLRAQTQPIEGVKVRRAFGRGTQSLLTVAGGQTETTVNGALGPTKYVGYLSQVTHETQPASWLRLKGSMVYQYNEADLPERYGASGFPRHNVISFAGADWALPANLTWSTHTAHSDYRSDDATDDDGLTGDWDWRSGLRWEKGGARWGAYYESIGERYASLGDPALYRDYQGWTLSGSRQMNPDWRLSSTMLLYRNNVADHPERVTTRNQAFSLSSSYQMTDTQLLNLTYNDVLAEPSGGLSDPGSASRSHLWRADHFMPFIFSRSRLLNTYQYFRNEATTASDTTSHTLGPTIFKSYGRGSSWYVSPQTTKTFREANDDELAFTTTFNVDHYLWPSLSVFWNSNYTWDRFEKNKATETVSWSTGFQHRPLRDTAFRVEYSVSSYNLRTERGKWPRSWSLLWYLSQGFGFQTAPKFGIVEGWVFHDLNANGVQEAGEPFVEEARLTLEDQRESLTDQRGHFQFTKLVPGSQVLSLDSGSVDPEWLVKEPRRAVQVRGRRRTKVWFPLVEGAAISAQVFLDDNQDGRFQDTEEPLEGVAVVLLPGEQFRRTNADGRVEFQPLLPGVYTIHVHREDLPQGYELILDRPQVLELKPGDQVEDVTFGVRMVPVPIKQF